MADTIGRITLPALVIIPSFAPPFTSNLTEARSKRARPRALTQEQRQEIARKAAAARWGKQTISAALPAS
jgi:hypothetical protein